MDASETVSIAEAQKWLINNLDGEINELLSRRSNYVGRADGAGMVSYFNQEIAAARKALEWLNAVKQGPTTRKEPLIYL